MLGDEYVLEERLYDGRRSTVFRGRATRDGAPVIVKRMQQAHQTPGDLARLQREHALSSTLGVPSVRPALAMTRIEGTWSLVLEDVGGEPLRAVLARGPLPLERTLTIFAALAHGLAEVHARHVIHKDVNPDNVLVDATCSRAWLIDFDLACQLTREHTSITNVDMLEGTLPYISPEQTGRTGHALDHRTDLYSLGCTFYEALTGRPPFPSNDVLELVYAHLARVADAPAAVNPAVPATVSAIAMRLLAKDPAARYKSAVGLRADLEACRDALAAGGDVPPFALGARDVATRLQLPDKLYGRDAEQTRLVEAFLRVAAGATELIVVTGAAGAGKTALIHAASGAMLRSRASVVAGKFEQLRRDAPYAAVGRAFAAHVREIIDGPRDARERLRDVMLGALDGQGAVLADVIPGLEQLLGTLGAVPELGPAESQNRFRYTFQRFVRSWTLEGQPLVLFLDDLQWADAASLELIELLVRDRGTRHTLVIGAYRDNEVGRADPLALALAALESERRPVERIALGPMTTESVGQYVADALEVPADVARELAAIAHAKTGGNPFFLRQFVERLYRDQLIELDVQAGKWQVHLEQIRAAPITENVLDLLADRLRALDATTLRALQLAACLGATFDLGTLAKALEEPPQRTARALQQALEEELLVALDASYRYAVSASEDEAGGLPATWMEQVRYRFCHDRIQAAVYDSIPVADLPRRRLALGRTLESIAGARGGERLSERRFDVLHHLNFARALITAPDERLALAQQNLDAGLQAKASTSYDIALQLLRVGLELLPPDAWSSARPLIFALSMAAGQCELLAGRPAEAERMFAVLLEHVTEPLEVAEVQRIRSALYNTRNQYDLACDAGLAAVRALGIDIDRKPSKARLILEILRTRRATKGTQKKTGPLDPRSAMVLRTLFAINDAAYFCDTNFALVTTCQVVRLALQGEGGDYASQARLSWSTVTVVIFGDWREAERQATLALQMAGESSDPALRIRVTNNYLGTVKHWREPLPASLAASREAFASSVQSGDFVYAGYAVSLLGFTMLALGEHAHSCIEELNRYDEFVRAAGDATRDVVAFHIQSQKALAGLTSSPGSFSDADFDEAAVWQRIQHPTIKTTEYTFAIDKLITLTTLGLHAEAWPFALMLQKDIHLVHAGIYSMAAHAFFGSLTACALAAGSAGAARRRQLSFARRYVRKLRGWAERCPANFEHQVAFVEAELARVEGGALATIIRKYEAAFVGAQRSGFTANEALAADRLGRLFTAEGMHDAAVGPLMRAHRAWTRQGVSARTAALEEDFPEVARLLRNRGVARGSAGSSEIDASALDAPTLIKASQALSGEIRGATLREQLLRLVMENAGARRAVLVSRAKEADGWQVSAAAHLHDGAIAIDAEARPITDDELPTRAVLAVVRSQSALLVDDASQEAAWVDDPFVVARGARSLLVMPILAQGSTKGVLYLENELASHAFTAERVQLLAVLCAQMGISLENAALYEDVEAALRAEQSARTREQAAHGERLKAERASAHLAASMEAARAVQEALLVPGEAVPFAEMAHLYRPAERAGGDWYGNYLSAERDRLYMLLGDVTGHGLPSALVTAAAAGAAASAIERLRVEAGTLAEDLHLVAHAVHHAVARTGGPSGRSMTMAFVALDLRTGEGHYLNAGHPPVLVASAGVPTLVEPGDPLGGDEAPHLGSRAFALEPGAALCLMSDGLIENRDGRGRFVKTSAVGRLLLAERSPAAFIAALTPLVDGFVQDEETDDTACVVLCWQGPGAA